ncbi:MAG: hypothetical protein FJX65_09370 [Alphaproteobacteria bacterium]|nr:hypothetical protein [Alphaproteobacteria bacterium]
MRIPSVISVLGVGLTLLAADLAMAQGPHSPPPGPTQRSPERPPTVITPLARVAPPPPRVQDAPPQRPAGPVVVAPPSGPKIVVEGLSPAEREALDRDIQRYAEEVGRDFKADKKLKLSVLESKPSRGGFLVTREYDDYNSLLSDGRPRFRWSITRPGCPPRPSVRSRRSRRRRARGLPHLVGAPRPAEASGPVPAELARQFIAASLLASAVFWLVLGGASGWLYGCRVLDNVTL